MKNKGFTLIELLIGVAIAGIGCAFLFSIATGHSIVPSKQDLIFTDQYEVYDEKTNKLILTPGFANGFGKQRFIALSNGPNNTDSNYNFDDTSVSQARAEVQQISSRGLR